MSEFKHFDGGEPFLRPEKPFLLIYTDTDDAVRYAWLETGDDLMEVVEEVKGYGCTIVDAIEIGSYRDVLISEYD